MSRYGFKILKAEVRRFGGTKTLPWENPDGKKVPVAYLDLVMEDFEALGKVDSAEGASATTQVDDANGTPTDDELSAHAGTHEDTDYDHADSPTLSGAQLTDDELAEAAEETAPDKPVYLTRIESARKFSSAILLKVSHGTIGDHATGIDPTSESDDVDLRDLATTRLYRVLIIAPVSGENGFLAVEVISRSHVTRALPRKLKESAQGRHKFVVKLLGAVADDDAVAELLKNPRLSRVELYKNVVTSDSAEPQMYKTTVSFSIGKQTVLESNLVKRARDWLPTEANRAKKKRPTASGEAQALATYLWPTLGEEEFDNAMMLLEKDGRTKRLQPLDMKEGFTYDIGDQEPDDNLFISRVKEVVDRLQLAGAVDLDPDWNLPDDGGSS